MKKQADSDTDRCYGKSKSKCNIEEKKDKSRIAEDIESLSSPQPSSVEADVNTESADWTNISSMRK